jgi:hypothetical protein
MRISTVLIVLLVGTAVPACDSQAPDVLDPPPAPLHMEHQGMDSPAAFDVNVPGGFVAEALGRGGFLDGIDAQFRIKLDGRKTSVVNVRDASDVIVVRITMEEGGSVGWHTHPGPAIATVVEGTLGVINAFDCVERHYPAGHAFIDPGQGNVHVGFNAAASGRTVLYATFLGIPPGVGPTIPADPVSC